jgi:hypothetical protein
LLQFVQFAIDIVVLVQCFRIKDMLEDHLAGPDEARIGSLLSSQIQLSGVMTFLFTIFYLQHVINREVLAPLQAAS